MQKLFVAPGNGGTAMLNKDRCFNVSPGSLVEFAQANAVGLVVVGPEQPLVDGIEAEFRRVGIPVFGPSKEAARLEGSKAFSKQFMAKHHIPTAAFQVFTEFQEAQLYLQQQASKLPVIKASGLAAGKGVLLPATLTEGLQGLKDIMLDGVYASAGSQVVLEERLEGEEVSLLCFSDGYTVIPMPAAQDHKRVADGDKGPNTGGMGAYCPAPVYTPSLAAEVTRRILQPTIDGMRRDGFPFVGVLYVGLMLTEEGPKVLEYNCRFGDPETQAILPLLEDHCDLAEIMLACAKGRLDSVPVAFNNAFSATIVAASKGYPGVYSKNHKITIDPRISSSNVTVFHAGTNIAAGELVTSGGRVLSVTGVAASLQDALNSCYAALPLISFDGMFYRRDIGYRAIELLQRQTAGGATYAAAGVSIDAGNLLVEKIKPFVKKTKRVGADADLGGFGGLFDLKAAGYSDAVLVSGTDGVGTKLKIAQAVGKHDTIGIDLVAMNVNDVVVQGAEPLFFLDYYASSKLEVDVATDVIKGIAQACLESGCALVGGETAEMPGIYQHGDYDLAGFVVGAVERDQVLPKLDTIKPGDVVLGIPSSGVHSNGFSLVRHVVRLAGLDYASPAPFATPQPGISLGEALLVPTRLYVKQLLPAVRKGLVKAMAHITGGGFVDNVPRALPDTVGVTIDASSWDLPPVFRWLKKAGRISDAELARTFNCGIGMVLIVSKNDVEAVIESLAAHNEKCRVLGSVVERLSQKEQVKMVAMETAWN